MDQFDITGFRDDLLRELKGNILDFWIRNTQDDDYGGFRGRISNDLIVEASAEKGIILNSRILWTFARAFREFQDERLIEIANRAFDYISRNFLDRDFGGVFWTVDYKGIPLDTRKRSYAQAFAIYGLSEYALATSSTPAREMAFELFDLLESKARDQAGGGYFETFDRDWKLAEDQRLSTVDQDQPKSMNSHLHVLEAYTNLLRASRTDQLMAATRDTLMLFIDHIVDHRTNHFRLFFDEAWQTKSDHVSFGHDIEGSWLLGEAAHHLGEIELSTKVASISLAMAEAVLEEGLDEDGAVFNEADSSGIIDYTKDWWPQAEGVVGFLNAYQLSSEPRFLKAAEGCWNFIKRRIIDRTNGEWFWKVSRSGAPDSTKPKVDQWKCPYHNARMCFEAMSRIDLLRSGSVTVFQGT